ncbi:Predicted oxidoreductase of the aldo/keto reductase family [Methanobrevibacter gottschalkii]|uniref:Predicted oxidoreductase of the aldo/keto reductase family n=3 Tax=Methanobacteriaceae TaxID=2159 RepID=A0A1H7M0N4_9EURY|nr:aldo/keto reductase [Methanobrevibacter sp. A27]RPF51686.1 putative aldo/keto reductase-like oxidoreductase [Methanobrevibacter gottschalkii DSM 11977]SEL04659.1 Predicted oxidoreductase of the aldo/keto reductase family [Methanobrevibacter gottschalkii]
MVIKMRLGKTNFKVNKNGFGALPIQRRNEKDSIEILKKAYDNGINFYDSARFYTDSEGKLGKAFEDIRENIYIATKTGTETPEEFWNDLETSLKELKTDYVDLYQFHNISFCPKEDDELYKAMLEAKEEGTVKHIGITTHKITHAHEALDSGLYETLQYPFSYLSGEEELNLVEKCRQLDVGFIAMKGMGGGLIKNSQASFAYMNQFDNVLPIWGIQELEELDEFLSYDANTILTADLKEYIEKDKEELGVNFCRGCGYCMPCPEEINISLCSRMSLWLRRFPTEPSLDEKTQKIMEKTKDCTECYSCVDKCPYELDIPELLKSNYEDYQNVLSGKTKV